MSGPAVVIELPAGSEVLAVRDLVDACTEHLRLPGGCAVSNDGTLDEAARAVAIVSWGPRQRTARVQVGIRGNDQPEWPSVELTFRPGDAAIERSRAVGLAIATLVGDASAPPSSPPAASSSSPPLQSPAPELDAPASTESRSISAAAPAASRPARPPSEPSPPAIPDDDAPPSARDPSPRTSTSHRAWIDLAGETLSGAVWGGALRGLYRVGKTHWMGIGSAGYLGGAVVDSATTVRLSRFQAAAGAAFADELEATTTVEGHIEVVLDWLRADARDPLLGQDEAAQLTGAIALGASCGLWLAPPLGVFVGADLMGHSRGTEVRVGNRAVASVPAIDWSALAGLRIGVN